MLKDLGSPLCLYRLGCTFPSAVNVEQTDKSAWSAALTHKATGRYFGFLDFKGGITLRIRSEEVYLQYFLRKYGDRESAVYRAMRRLMDRNSMKDASEPYLETLPQEWARPFSAPQTGDPELLEEMTKFAEDSRVFKQDMMELLNYLASDQCVHGYDDLVAGYEA